MPTPFLSSEEYDERAHQLYNEGQYDEALTVLREGLTLYPSSVELHVGVGYARLAREEYAWARRAFEEALEIIEHLRSKRSVILNLHLLDTAQSQRVVDFLSGATHAIDGHQQRIGDGVFIFTPNNVSIRSDAEQPDAGVAIQDAFWKPGVY